MAASISTSDGALPPSPAQIALALAIVKHKPAHLDIKGNLPPMVEGNLLTSADHILQIRSFIKNSRTASRPAPDDKFFDSVSFWQQAYEKSEAEQSKLLDRIYELEQRNESLAAKLRPETHDLPVSEEKQPDSLKRKGADAKDTTGNASARKRAKTQAPAQGNNLNQGLGNVLDRVDYMEEGVFVYVSSAAS